jgi:hypothetical protein
MRSEERRDACERLVVGDTVKFEREPDNPHDANAILVLGDDDCELGYVPREDARDIAPLLDGGAEANATVRRLWETPDTGYVVPIVFLKVLQGDADPSAVKRTRQRGKRERAAAPKTPRGCGCCGPAAACFVLLVVLILVAMIRGL